MRKNSGILVKVLMSFYYRKRMIFYLFFTDLNLPIKIFHYQNIDGAFETLGGEKLRIFKTLIILVNSSYTHFFRSLIYTSGSLGSHPYLLP